MVSAYLKSYFNIKPVTEMYVYKNTEEVLDKIDEESKKYFPLVSMLLNSFFFVIDKKEISAVVFVPGKPYSLV
jgi:hypothetical protein